MYRFTPALALFCLSSLFFTAPAAATHDFPWITPFDNGRYIGELLPAGVVESDYENIAKHIEGKDIDVIILDGDGAGLHTVSLGLYDNNKRDVAPLWDSELQGELPHTIENADFDQLFIKYTYLPGDKYVSCNFKVAVDASFGTDKPKIKIFAVERDIDYAGASLKSGDFILACDSGANGALSNLDNGDYTDLVFVISIRPEPALPLTHAFFAISGFGIIGVTLWSIQRGRKGLRSFTL